VLATGPWSRPRRRRCSILFDAECRANGGGVCRGGWFLGGRRVGGVRAERFPGAVPLGRPGWSVWAAAPVAAAPGPAAPVPAAAVPAAAGAAAGPTAPAARWPVGVSSRVG